MTASPSHAVMEALGAEVQVASFTPGRLRLKLRALKHDAEYAGEIEDALIDVDGIERVHANPVTGSVLIEYDVEGEVDFPGLFAAAKQLGIIPPHLADGRLVSLLTSPRLPAKPWTGRRPYQALDHGFTSLNTRVRQATGGMADLRDVIPLGLAGLALSNMLRRGRGARVMWPALLWYAFQSLRAFHPGIFAGERMPAAGPELVDAAEAELDTDAEGAD